MQEAFLHYVWKHKKLSTFTDLKTEQDESIIIHSVGIHNHNSGPDFFNVQLSIAGQKWAGNLEIHIKSSDWYVHNHENDEAYENVILHVVWENDTEVFRKDNSAISTLTLNKYINQELLNKYQALAAKKNKWIYCENEFASVSDFTLSNWLERLFIERLERKAKDIEVMLSRSQNNWEAVLFTLLAKNFGLKVNGEAFQSIAQSIPWHVVQKVRHNRIEVEALLFGQAGLLDEDIEDPYFINLKESYTYLKHKFQLNTHGVLPVKFFRLRPSNFPTIRLAQLGSLYHKQSQLFSKLVDVQSPQDAYKLFECSVSSYWENCYTFKIASRKTSKNLTKKFIDLLLINSIIPLQFSYAKYQGNNVSEAVINLAASIAPEQNSIVSKFNSLKTVRSSALHSQALIQLKTMYCDKQKCLDCAVGNEILSRK